LYLTFCRNKKNLSNLGKVINTYKYYLIVVIRMAAAVHTSPQGGHTRQMAVEQMPGGYRL